MGTDQLSSISCTLSVTNAKLIKASFRSIPTQDHQPSALLLPATSASQPTPHGVSNPFSRLPDRLRLLASQLLAPNERSVNLRHRRHRRILRSDAISMIRTVKTSRLLAGKTSKRTERRLRPMAPPVESQLSRPSMISQRSQGSKATAIRAVLIAHASGFTMAKLHL